MTDSQTACLRDMGCLEEIKEYIQTVYQSR